MVNNIGSTLRILKFYAEDTDTYKRWYLDSPEYIAQGGTKEELEMVAGADILLDRLSHEGDNVSIEISEDHFKDCSVLERIDQSEDLIKSIFNVEASSGAIYYVGAVGDDDIRDYLWLCDVTMYIFDGKFPKMIYFKVV